MPSRIVRPGPVPRASSLVVAALAVAGGACDGTSEDGPIAEVVEVGFDVPLGPQRATAWTVDARRTSGSGFEGCFALSRDDGLFFQTHDLVIEKRGHGPLTDPALWSHPADELRQCPVIQAMPDGGALVVGGAYATTAPDPFPITRLGSDGAPLWTHLIADHDPVVESAEVASTPMTAGGIAFSYRSYSEAIPAFVVRLDAAGQEVWRTEIPKMLVASADAIGHQQGPGSPGSGVPTVLALSEAPDGGLFFTGRYWFMRGIACGSESDPRNPLPGGLVCNSTARNGLVGRLDAAGHLLWVRRLGHAYAGGSLIFEFAAALTDGSVLATGWIIPEQEWADLLHLQALAARYDGAGRLQWAKAFPWGPAPGGTFVDQSKFDAVVAREGGSADVVLRPPAGHAPSGDSCRLLRFEPSGEISRIQILEYQGCEPRTEGADLAYAYSPNPTSALISKLAP